MSDPGAGTDYERRHLEIGLRKLRNYRGGAVLSDAEAEALLGELVAVRAERDEALNVREGYISPVQKVVALQRELVAVREERDTLREALREYDEALDEARADFASEGLQDALAYVEMRRDVLGPNDPLVALADWCIGLEVTVRAAVSAIARAALSVVDTRPEDPGGTAGAVPGSGEGQA